MREVLETWVHPESIVTSDEWGAYPPALEATGIENQRTVNHSENFINPRIGIHTQNVESL